MGSGIESETYFTQSKQTHYSYQEGFNGNEKKLGNSFEYGTIVVR